MILYDPHKGRVAAAEEQFRVTGSLVVGLLGVDTAIDMDETQVFRLRVRADKPPEK